MRVESDVVERFEQVVLPHLGAALTLARYLLRDAADAEDAVQEACLKALRHFRGFRGENPRAWLLTIVRRECYHWADRDSRYGVRADADLIAGVADESEDAETAMLRGELREVIQRAVDELPLPFREVIVLREIQELSYAEIASVTGVPVGTVMSRLARARRRLERTLEARELGGWT